MKGRVWCPLCYREFLYPHGDEAGVEQFRREFRAHGAECANTSPETRADRRAVVLAAEPLAPESTRRAGAKGEAELTTGANAPASSGRGLKAPAPLDVPPGI